MIGTDVLEQKLEKTARIHTHTHIELCVTASDFHSKSLSGQCAAALAADLIVYHDKMGFTLYATIRERELANAFVHFVVSRFVQISSHLIDRH